MITTRPPTTPPAIAPALECDEEEVLPTGVSAKLLFDGSTEVVVGWVGVIDVDVDDDEGSVVEVPLRTTTCF